MSPLITGFLMKSMQLLMTHCLCVQNDVSSNRTSFLQLMTKVQWIDKSLRLYLTFISVENLLINIESLSFLKGYDIYEAVKMSQVLILHKFLLACLYLENVIETCAIISIRSTGYTKSYPTIWSPCTYL